MTLNVKFCLPALLVALMVIRCGPNDGADSTAGTGERSSPDEDIPLAEEFDLKAYVLNFWATWCGPCRIEIPDLVKLRKSFRPEEVAIIGVATGENGPQRQVQQLLKTAAAEYDINYELFFDHDNALYAEWAQRESLFGVPSTLLFNSSGELRGKHLGVPIHDLYGGAYRNRYKICYPIFRQFDARTEEGAASDTVPLLLLQTCPRTSADVVLEYLLSVTFDQNLLELHDRRAVAQVLDHRLLRHHQ